jgi:four helix bundle protein
MAESFKDLVVWQRAVQMSLEIYKLTSSFPASERFGLTNQLRRASVSVASNIAEGYGKSSRGEYVSFLGHAEAQTAKSRRNLSFRKGCTSARKSPCTRQNLFPTKSAACWLR